MKSAFPNRYIDKTDPEYQTRYRHVFVLKPPSQGATAHDFASFAENLKLGIEAKVLSDPDLIPRSSLNGRTLTLQSLREDVTGIISGLPTEWVDGCVGISIMHPPDVRKTLTAIMSNLPISAQVPSQKLMSVIQGDKSYAFRVQLHENPLMSEGSLVIGLDNPTEPAAEHIVPIDRREAVQFNDLYGSKRKMEDFAMGSLCRLLLASGIVSPNDPGPLYEPLGNAFPDFELTIRNQDWAVEITRIEAGMVSYLQVSKPLEKGTFDKVTQNEVTESNIIGALTDALAYKMKRRKDCPYYSRACLLLVDVVDSIDANASAIWGGIDMSAFDAVALVKMDGNVTFVKQSYDLE